MQTFDLKIAGVDTPVTALGGIILDHSGAAGSGQLHLLPRATALSLRAELIAHASLTNSPAKAIDIVDTLIQTSPAVRVSRHASKVVVGTRQPLSRPMSSTERCSFWGSFCEDVAAIALTNSVATTTGQTLAVPWYTAPPTIIDQKLVTIGNLAATGVTPSAMAYGLYAAQLAVVLNAALAKWGLTANVSVQSLAIGTKAGYGSAVTGSMVAKVGANIDVTQSLSSISLDCYWNPPSTPGFTRFNLIGNHNGQSSYMVSALIWTGEITPYTVVLDLATHMGVNKTEIVSTSSSLWGDTWWPFAIIMPIGLPFVADGYMGKLVRGQVVGLPTGDTSLTPLTAGPWKGVYQTVNSWVHWTFPNCGASAVAVGTSTAHWSGTLNTVIEEAELAWRFAPMPWVCSPPGTSSVASIMTTALSALPGVPAGLSNDDLDLSHGDFIIIVGPAFADSWALTCDAASWTPTTRRLNVTTGAEVIECSVTNPAVSRAATAVNMRWTGPLSTVALTVPNVAVRPVTENGIRCTAYHTYIVEKYPEGATDFDFDLGGGFKLSQAIVAMPATTRFALMSVPSPLTTCGTPPPGCSLNLAHRWTDGVIEQENTPGVWAALNPAGVLYVLSNQGKPSVGWTGSDAQAAVVAAARSYSLRQTQVRTTEPFKIKDNYSDWDIGDALAKTLNIGYPVALIPGVVGWDIMMRAAVIAARSPSVVALLGVSRATQLNGEITTPFAQSYDAVIAANNPFKNGAILTDALPANLRDGLGATVGRGDRDPS